MISAFCPILISSLIQFNENREDADPFLYSAVSPAFNDPPKMDQSKVEREETKELEVDISGNQAGPSPTVRFPRKPPPTSPHFQSPSCLGNFGRFYSSPCVIFLFNLV